jgi:hypothetical protein
MEMQMEDKKNSKNNMSMTCTQIEKEPITIRKADYTSMGGQ